MYLFIYYTKPDPATTFDKTPHQSFWHYNINILSLKAEGFHLLQKTNLCINLCGRAGRWGNPGPLCYHAPNNPLETRLQNMQHVFVSEGYYQLNLGAKHQAENVWHFS